MYSSVIIIALFAGLLVISITLWALFLWLGLRWAGVLNVTLRRAFLTAVTVTALQIPLTVLFRLYSPSSAALEIVCGITQLALAVLIPCLLIMAFFKMRFLRALQAWLPTLIPSVFMLLFGLFFFRPFICEAFVSPTNGMAPTLLGGHWQGACPECGSPNFCSAVVAGFGAPEPPPMICENFHVHRVTEFDASVQAGDRFLVAKFLTPRRWDIVVFEAPDDPTHLFVMRVVGLPGEKIHIADGAVWANDRRLEPPDALRGIEYVTQISDYPMDCWGAVDRPAVLADDEYFVLGDFSYQSRDSRFWERGVPGHSPFAVPKASLHGVATHIYWPFQRRRILR